MLVLTCHIGPQRLAIDSRCVREVVPWVPLQPVAGSAVWLAGLLVHRGRTVPVIDLHRLLDAGECPRLLSSRIVLVLVNTGAEQELVGLLAAQVSALCELAPDAESPSALIEKDQLQLGPLVVVDKEVWRLLEPERLLSALRQEEARA